MYSLAACKSYAQPVVCQITAGNIAHYLCHIMDIVYRHVTWFSTQNTRHSPELPICLKTTALDRCWANVGDVGPTSMRCCAELMILFFFISPW